MLTHKVISQRVPGSLYPTTVTTWPAARLIFTEVAKWAASPSGQPHPRQTLVSRSLDTPRALILAP